MSIQNETIQNLFSDLGIDAAYESVALLQLEHVDSRFLKDMKLNVANVLSGTNIERKQAILLALSVAANERNNLLSIAFKSLAIKEGASDAEIAEVFACASLMAANNILYRFRHFVHEVPFYENAPAGMRMSTMMNPVLGKEFFELMSIAISAVNGCERCVKAHEHSVKQLGSSEARIFDAVRIAAVIKSLCVVI
jgi:lipoyl-dependent peroxiredoxin subunit D